MICMYFYDMWCVDFRYDTYDISDTYIYIYLFIISYIPEGLGHLRWGRVGWGELGLGGGWGNNVHVHLKTCALLMLHMTKGQLGRHGLSRNVSDPIEHRWVLALHYLNKNPGLNPVLLALFGPVQKVCRTFLHACRLSVKFFQTHRGNVKTNLQTEHDNKEMEMEHNNKKWLSRCGLVHDV